MISLNNFEITLLKKIKDDIYILNGYYVVVPSIDHQSSVKREEGIFNCLREIVYPCKIKLSDKVTIVFDSDYHLFKGVIAYDRLGRFSRYSSFSYDWKDDKIKRHIALSIDVYKSAVFQNRKYTKEPNMLPVYRFEDKKLIEV